MLSVLIRVNPWLNFLIRELSGLVAVQLPDEQAGGFHSNAIPDLNIEQRLEVGRLMPV